MNLISYINKVKSNNCCDKVFDMAEIIDNFKHLIYTELKSFMFGSAIQRIAENNNLNAIISPQSSLLYIGRSFGKSYPWGLPSDLLQIDIS